MKTLPPFNWSPTPKMREWAAEHLQDVDSFIQDYIAGCHAKGLKYANHDMAFRNWIKLAVQRNPGLKRLPEPSRSAQVAPAEPSYDSRHWDTRLKNLSQDPFWDILAAAGKPKGFARRTNPDGEVTYTWDRMPEGLVVRCVEDVR